MINELIQIEEKTVLEAFTIPGGLNSVVGEVRGIVENVSYDMSTATGRKEPASLAAKIAKLKVRLDDLGKGLTVDWKAKAKSVDAARKELRESLDDLKILARKPLTDFEVAEAERVQKHKEDIREMVDGGSVSRENWQTLPLQAMKDRLEEIKKEDVSESRFEEFAGEALSARKVAVDLITSAIEIRETYDAEQAELETLRKEKEARDQADHEEAIRKAAAEQAAGAERARQDKEKAAEIAAQEAEEAKQKAREKNTQHVAKIRGEAKVSLMDLSDNITGEFPIDEDLAIFIVKAIHAGKIKNVSIKY